MIVEVLANDLMFLTQQIETNIKGLTAFDFLGFSTALKENIYPRALSSHFLFRHVTYAEKTLNLSTDTILTVNQSSVSRAFDLIATDWLLPTQDLINEPQFPSVTSQAAFDQDIVLSQAKGTYSALAIVQNLSLTVTKNLAITSSLNIISEVVGFIPSYFWQSDVFVVEVP